MPPVDNPVQWGYSESSRQKSAAEYIFRQRVIARKCAQGSLAVLITSGYHIALVLLGDVR